MSTDFFPEDKTPSEVPEAPPMGDEQAFQVASQSTPADEIPVTVEKPKRSSSSKSGKRSGWTLVGCIAIFAAVPLTCCAFMFACGAIFFGLAAASESNAVTRSESQSLEVVDLEDVTLEVTNQIGETSIRGEDVETILVEMDLRATGLSKDRAQANLDDITVDIRREGDRYIVAVQNGGEAEPFNDRHVDLRITVPERLNITASNNVGAMQVRDVVIADALDLENNIGDITFEGTIGPNGQHSITNNIGAIQVNVDSDSQFDLEASSDIGEVEVDLDLDNLNRDQAGSGEEVLGTYGDRQNEATLTLTANIGKITVDD